MPWIEAGEFQRLCDGELKADLDRSEAIRSAGVNRFWLRLAIVVVVGGALVAVAAVYFDLIGFWAASVLALVVGAIVVPGPLAQARRAIKGPIAQAVARHHQLTWTEGVLLEALVKAERPLFGAVTRRSFGDAWSGEIDGRAFCVAEQTLTRQAGKNSVTVFQGHLWRLAAGRGYPDVTLALPDKGAFNLFEQRGGMTKVRFENDVGFEGAFELFGSDADATRSLFTAELRAELTALKADAGRVWLYLGGDDVIVAVAGGDRFEPGSLFKRTPGVERARTMWNEVEGAVGFARRLAAAFPQR